MKIIFIAYYSLLVVCFLAASAIAEDKVVVIPLLKSTPSAETKLIFLTDGTWNGDLGGLKGADDKCNTEAKTRGFMGTFKALLGSNIGGNPQYRLIHYPVKYVSEAGKTLNSSYHELFTSYLDNPIKNIVENVDALVWSGLDATGSSNGATCNDWTSTASNPFGGPNGSVGRANAIQSSEWLFNSYASCSFEARLYCVEQ